MQIIFTVPDDKIQRVIEAMIALHSIPLDINGQPLFTPAAWAKECVRWWIIRRVLEYERRIAEEQLIQAIQPDAELIT